MRAVLRQKERDSYRPGSTDAKISRNFWAGQLSDAPFLLMAASLVRSAGLAQLGKDNFVVRHDAVGRLRHDGHPQLRFRPHQGGTGVVGKAEDLRRDAFFGKGLKQQLFKPAVEDERGLLQRTQRQDRAVGSTRREQRRDARRDHRLLLQVAAVHLLVVEGGAHHRQLNESRFQHLHQLEGVALVDGKADLRVLLVKGRDAPVQERRPRRGDGADVQRAGKAAGHRLQLLLGALGQLQDSLGSLIEHLARLGQLHAARPRRCKSCRCSSSSNSLSW